MVAYGRISRVCKLEFETRVSRVFSPNSNSSLKVLKLEFLKQANHYQKISVILKKSLLSIKPTSVEPERAFFVMNAFFTKIRNCLNDDTMDAMISLRQYYKNKAKNK